MSATKYKTSTIVSVGYERRTVDELVHLLRTNKVEVLVDVRLTPISRKKGFSKKALAAALLEAGIDYQHERALGNPKENREAFRSGSSVARKKYVAHLRNGSTPVFEKVMDLAKSKRIALLCFERAHEECHRSCIIEEAQDRHPTLSVMKL